uniref:Ig-like domain-containing protein n=1 Tax=Poecilia formosa TaxID=48698 RepID=A0A096MFJ5_POEFO
NTVSILVKLNKPAAKLTASDTIIPAGGSVTLTCSVSGSDGWKFDLLRRESVDHTGQFIRNNDPNGVFIITVEGVYSCRGGRGDPVFYTETSNKVTIWKTGESSVNKPAAKLTASDTIIPAGGSVTLTCSVSGSDGWKFDLLRRQSVDHKDQFIRTNEPDGVFIISDEGVYSCRGGRGDPVFYTETSIKVIINEIGEFSFCQLVPVLSVSPSWLNPGASVTLSCEGLEHQPAGWRFFWYKAVPDPSLPGTSGTEQNFTINGPTHTAGFVCRAGRGEPVNYTDYSEPKFIWSAVTVSSPVSSSFLVMLIVGIVLIILMILMILLVLLWRCRRSKDKHTDKNVLTKPKKRTIKKVVDS